MSLEAPLHLNNRSTAVFKKLITFLAVAKVSRDALRCNIGSWDQIKSQWRAERVAFDEYSM